MHKIADNGKPITRRAYSIDALRGYAILTMVLSATIVYGILPAWMYHAQEPPPTHTYHPELDMGILGISFLPLYHGSRVSLLAAS